MLCWASQFMISFLLVWYVHDIVLYFVKLSDLKNAFVFASYFYNRIASQEVKGYPNSM